MSDKDDTQMEGQLTIEFLDYARFDKCIRSKCLTHSQVGVYLALMAIISATGRTNVNAARVAKLAGCSVSSVRWTVRAMEKDGIITVTRKQGNRGNRYFLNSQE